MDMKTLKKAAIINLNIAFSIAEIKDVYLLLHENCSAIKLYLKCSGYPELGENNRKEIKISSKLLVLSQNYLKKQYPLKNYKLQLIDLNGTVAQFDPLDKIWTIIYIGKYNDPQALWYGYQITDKYKV